MRDHDRLLEVLKPYQLEKLERDVHKGDWRNATISTLLEQLHNEFHELQLAVYDLEPNASIIQECADIANFAAMIADKILSEAE